MVYCWHASKPESKFFKSTSISIAAFECWLKIVETDEIFSEKECQKIYSEKKEEENRLKKDNLIKVYKLAFDGNEFDGDYSSIYFLDNADSSRYYPDDADLAVSLRYYMKDPMDEDDKSQLI